MFYPKKPQEVQINSAFVGAAVAAVSLFPDLEGKVTTKHSFRDTEPRIVYNGSNGAQTVLAHYFGGTVYSEPNQPGDTSPSWADLICRALGADAERVTFADLTPKGSEKDARIAQAFGRTA